MIVVDASALLEALLRTPVAEAVERRLFADRESLHAPHLIDVEVAQVVRRYLASGQVDQARGQAALADHQALPLRRYPHDVLLPRVWELRHSLTAYDAVYVALAEALGCALVTADGRLARAPGLGCAVDLLRSS